MPNRLELVGKRFVRLVVRKFCRTINGRSLWECVMDHYLLLNTILKLNIGVRNES